MKRFALLALAVTMAACGSNNTPAPTTNANTLIFTAQLTAAKEVPAVTNADVNASGSATITLNVTRDASNNITGGTASWTYSVQGFPANTTIILNHIHEGVDTSTGPIRIDSGLTAASPLTLTNGTLTNQTYSNLTPKVGGVDDFTVFQRMASNPNGFYFNVHSSINPGGAVRGQLVRTQ
jgi:CHRD domain